ncbi:hypothetical protein E1B28_010406 [Marasmius oreades]|nr:uncharacterized protein E1B28_010406 [Marasmius oreades]KAG7091366.1 hypothetical protein E1B28_010406 [Marasmius oreades]
MQGSVTLEPDGSLDTGKLMLLWGLEHCVPVNPGTLIPMHTYELRRTDIIPKQAVMKLIGKRRSIAFLEWEDVTQSTASKREVREMHWTFTTSLSILYNVFAGFLHDISPPLSSMFPSFASLTQVLGELYGRLANVAQLMLTRVYTTSLLHVERYHRLLRCLYLETGIAEAVREIAQITNSEGTLTVIALVGVILFGFWASGYGF